MHRLLPGPSGDGGPSLDEAVLVDAYRLSAGRSLRANFVASLDGAITVGGVSEGLGGCPLANPTTATTTHAVNMSVPP